MLVLASCNSLLMEKPTPAAYLLSRPTNGAFAQIPHEIIKDKIIFYFITLKRTPLYHAQTFHALCKSNKYFSQFLKDPKINEILIKNMARYKNWKKKWIPICKKRLLFSAAFQLNTVGARLYIKTFGQPNSIYFLSLRDAFSYPCAARLSRFLLQAGHDPNYLQWGDSPLQRAAATNNLKCVKELLKHGANPNYFNSNVPPPTYLPLRIALKQKSSYRIISQLLLYGADPTLVDGTGKSPLDFARKFPVRTATLQLMERYAKRYQNQKDEQLLAQQ